LAAKESGKRGQDHGAFDESLLEILKNISELLFGHRTRDELFEHLLAELRQGRFAARCGCLGLARRECQDFCV
jgi:hypothetical protein